MLIDVINTKQFEYVEGSATGGLTEGEDSEGNKTVTWNIGEIPEKDASVSFKIKAWAGVGRWYSYKRKCYIDLYGY